MEGKESVGSPSSSNGGEGGGDTDLSDSLSAEVTAIVENTLSTQLSAIHAGIRPAPLAMETDGEGAGDEQPTPAACVVIVSPEPEAQVLPAPLVQNKPSTVKSKEGPLSDRHTDWELDSLRQDARECLMADLTDFSFQERIRHITGAPEPFAFVRARDPHDLTKVVGICLCVPLLKSIDFPDISHVSLDNLEDITKKQARQIKSALDQARVLLCWKRNLLYKFINTSGGVEAELNKFSSIFPYGVETPTEWSLWNDRLGNEIAKLSLTYGALSTLLTALRSIHNPDRLESLYGAFLPNAIEISDEDSISGSSNPLFSRLVGIIKADPLLHGMNPDILRKQFESSVMGRDVHLFSDELCSVTYTPVVAPTTKAATPVSSVRLDRLICLTNKSTDCERPWNHFSTKCEGPFVPMWNRGGNNLCSWFKHTVGYVGSLSSFYMKDSDLYIRCPYNACEEQVRLRDKFVPHVLRDHTGDHPVSCVRCCRVWPGSKGGLLAYYVHLKVLHPDIAQEEYEHAEVHWPYSPDDVRCDLSVHPPMVEHYIATLASNLFFKEYLMERYSRHLGMLYVKHTQGVVLPMKKGGPAISVTWKRHAVSAAFIGEPGTVYVEYPTAERKGSTGAHLDYIIPPLASSASTDTKVSAKKANKRSHSRTKNYLLDSSDSEGEAEVEMVGSEESSSSHKSKSKAKAKGAADKHAKKHGESSKRRRVHTSTTSSSKEQKVKDSVKVKTKDSKSKKATDPHSSTVKAKPSSKEAKKTPTAAASKPPTQRDLSSLDPHSPLYAAESQAAEHKARSAANFAMVVKKGLVQSKTSSKSSSAKTDSSQLLAPTINVTTTPQALRKPSVARTVTFTRTSAAEGVPSPDSPLAGDESAGAQTLSGSLQSRMYSYTGIQQSIKMLQQQAASLIAHGRAYRAKETDVRREKLSPAGSLVLVVNPDDPTDFTVRRYIHTLSGCGVDTKPEDLPEIIKQKFRDLVKRMDASDPAKVVDPYAGDPSLIPILGLGGSSPEGDRDPGAGGDGPGMFSID